MKSICSMSSTDFKNSFHLIPVDHFIELETDNDIRMKTEFKYIQIYTYINQSHKSYLYMYLFMYYIIKYHPICIYNICIYTCTHYTRVSCN